MTKTPEELTEDWRAGKLDVGFYYVKGADGMFGVMSDYALYKVNLSHPDNEITLLAPVPTYDEYKAMQAAIQKGESAIDTNKRLCKTIEELEEKVKDKKELIQCLGSNIDYLDTKKMILIIENNKLRGLLKECLAHLSLGEIGTSVTPLNILLTRINAAIGESEEQ